MSFWSRRSIAVKLPVAIALLLLLAFGAMTTAVYFAVRDTLVSIASDRLEQATTQISNAVAAGLRQRAALVRTVANDTSIVDYFHTPDLTHADTAIAFIVRSLGNTAEIASIELWDPQGKRLLIGGAAADPYNAERVQELVQTYAKSTGPAYTRMWQEGTGFPNPVGTAVRDGGTILGFVSERRRSAANSAQSRNLLSGLIGAEATILVGNRDGSLWTDLATHVSGPPVDVSDPAALLEYSRDGRPRTFARASPVGDMPLMTIIEFPVAIVLAPAQQFLTRAVATMLIVVLLASAIAFFYSRSITTPLRQVTEAAEAVAVAEAKVHVEFAREDELGRLADSFNTMAERVEHSRHQYETLVNELEHRVDERTSALKDANRELEAFSYSVSHDLRAPVRAISGFVQILEEDHAAKLDAEGLRTLGVVRRNAARMGRLIDDLLDFARLGRTSLERSPIDMNTLVKDVVADVTRDKPDVKVTIDPLRAATGEPGLVEQIMVNLISNAVKFSAKQEQPTVHVGMQEKRETGEVIYFVRDNGVGFDMQFIDKLFGVFQRLHAGEGFDGTGVGLAIIHRIVTKHGGRVWAEGAVGKGATFYFTLAPARVAVPA